MSHFSRNIATAKVHKIIGPAKFILSKGGKGVLLQKN